MGKIQQPSVDEQRDAYIEYNKLALKRTLRVMFQKMIDVREEELAQAGDNAGDAMNFGYIGYRMALEDVYFELYGENIPEVKNASNISFEAVRV